MAVNWLEGWLKNRWVHHSLRLAFALLITVLLSPFKLDLIEYAGYDLRMQLTPSPRTRAISCWFRLNTTPLKN
jgi:hypothetical protein